MTQYTTLTKKEVETILIPYGVKQIISFKILSGGSENTNYQVQTNSEKLVVTICELKTEKNATELAQLLEHLAHNNFETSIFFTTLVFIVVFIYTKYFIEILIGWAFNISKFVVSFNLQKNSFNKLLGIFIILLNSLAIYSFPNSIIFIKISIFFVISLYVVGLYKVIRLNDNLILSNMFYFILYLCTLEIVPILFIINELI